MACLSAGISLQNGVIDAVGIAHYVRWSIGRRHGCFRLCDFEDGDDARRGAVAVDVTRLVTVEEP
jgi:hypothetical protein